MEVYKIKSLLKVVLVGEGSVGKTAILDQYVHGSFTGRYKATIGADFETKEILVDGRRTCLQIWDTASQERFKSLGSVFYRGSDACVLVYDLCNATSFQQLEKWAEEFLIQADASPSLFPFIVLGNKKDLVDACPETRDVSLHRAQSWCAQYGWSHFEVSARTGQHLNEAFACLVSKTAYREPIQPIFEPKSVKIEFHEKEQRRCC